MIDETINKLWFIVREGDELKVVTERDVNDRKVFTQPFEGKKEADDWLKDYQENKQSTTKVEQVH